MAPRTARASETTRLEAFSDAVFAIVLTLLVLDLLPGDRAASPAELLGQWPTYLAYLTAFLTVGSIWLSHHDTVTRLRAVDPAVLVLNLVLLLGTSLVPWPTSLISVALRDGNRTDATAAILVYSLVTLVIGLSWTALYLRIARRPLLLRSPADVTWMRARARASAGTIVVAVVTAGVAFVLPLVSLIIYLVVPAFFVVQSLFEREPAETDAVAGADAD